MLEAMARHGVEPRDLGYILVTHHHYDHTGNLAVLKMMSGARVAAGEKDAEVITGKRAPGGPGDITRIGRLLRRLPPSLLERYQGFEPCEVDLALGDGDALQELGLEALELPGHTEGGMAYYHRGERLAFVGDLVSNIFRRPGPPVLSFSYDKKAILHSVRRLAELDLEYAYPGHGAVLGPGASRIVARLAASLASRWGLS